MKNKKIIQIMQQMVRKSDKIMNDIVNLTMQISAQSCLYRNNDIRLSVNPQNSESSKKEIDDFRNLLIEQFNKSVTNNLQAK